jgi:hypothetical protein
VDGVLGGSHGFANASLLWMVDFMPVKQIVGTTAFTKQPPEERHFFEVYKVQKGTGWIGLRMKPLGQGERAIWEHADFDRVKWMHVVDLDEWSVMPTKVVSPLYMFAVGSIQADGVGGECAFMRDPLGFERIVMNYQDLHGYANVPATSVRKMNLHVPMPARLRNTILKNKATHAVPAEEEDGDEEDEDEEEKKEDKDAEVMALMMFRNPDVEADVVLERIRQGHLPTKEDLSELQEAVDQDVASYLLLHQEFVTTREWLKSAMKTKTKTKESRFKCYDKVLDYYPEARVALGKPAPKAAALKKILSRPTDHWLTLNPFKKTSAAWRAQICAKAPEVVQRLKPPNCTARDDTIMGAWRLTHNQEQLPAWSYTDRGDGQAMRGALVTMWEAYTTATKRECPWWDEIQAIQDD